MYIEKIIDDKYPVCVIGDIHGCLDEFKELITDNTGWDINSYGYMVPKQDAKILYQFVLVGDYIDKGTLVKETIEFLYENKMHFTIVIGNHEHFVYKYLAGEIDNKGKAKENNQFLIDNWFETVKLLEQDLQLHNKFNILFHESCYRARNSSIYITHAPCKDKYLSMDNNKAINRMRTIVYPKLQDYKDTKEFNKAKHERLHFILAEADDNKPVHIFGHIALSEIFQYKNKICIDSGCVNGGYLSCAIFYPDKPKTPSFKSYRAKNNKKEFMFSLFDNEYILNLELKIKNQN